jgi:hypothetical protein
MDHPCADIYNWLMDSENLPQRPPPVRHDMFTKTCSALFRHNLGVVQDNRPPITLLAEQLHLDIAKFVANDIASE